MKYALLFTLTVIPALIGCGIVFIYWIKCIYDKIIKYIRVNRIINALCADRQEDLRIICKMICYAKLTKNDILSENNCRMSIFKTACLCCNFGCNFEVIQQLIIAGNLQKEDFMIPPENYSGNLFSWVVIRCSSELVCKIVDNFNINRNGIMQKNYNGYTAFYYAVFNNRMSTVKMFIDKHLVTHKDILHKYGYRQNTVLDCASTCMTKLLMSEIRKKMQTSEKNYKEIFDYFNLRYNRIKNPNRELTELTKRCCICLEDMHLKEMIFTLCKHHYCVGCYISYRYEYKKSSCAMCRQELTDHIQLDKSFILSAN